LKNKPMYPLTPPPLILPNLRINKRLMRMPPRPPRLPFI
jgi:hypothetical protein